MIFKNINLKFLAFSFLLLILWSCAGSKRGNSSKPIDKMSEFVKQAGRICYYTDNYEKCSFKRVPRAVFSKLRSPQLSKVEEFVAAQIEGYPQSIEYVVVHYYPGEDINNSTGRATRNDIGQWNKKVNKRIDKMSNVSQLCLYKDDEGLSRFDKHRNYIEDSELIISNAFFKHHYPGSSYLIWHKSGVYFTYYGEHMYQDVLDNLDLFRSIFEENN